MTDSDKAKSPAQMLARLVLLFAVGIALSFGTPYVLRAIGAGAWAKQAFGPGGFYELYIAAGFACVLIAVMVQWHAGPGRAFQELGIGDLAPRGCAVCGAAIAVAVAILLYAGAKYQSAQPVDIVLFGLVGPFVEEVFFRGYLFRQARRWAGAPFLLAALASSLLFGANHFDQGDSLADSFMNAAITFGGGVLFCWLVERWNSIWPGFVVHAGLNVAWTLYTLGDNAVGGSMGNIARLAVILVAIGGTLALTWRPRSVLASG